MTMLRTTLAGEPVDLHPNGAMYLPSHHTWLVADAHFGKATSFRAQGVPVPSGTTSETLRRINDLLQSTPPQQQQAPQPQPLHIVFLGDFLHSAHAHAASTQNALAAWRAAHPQLLLTLVRGNHDDRAGDPPAALGIHVVDEPLRLGPFALCHHPQAVAGAYTLAGHWHPCIVLSGAGRDRLRLPCFWLGSDTDDLSARPVSNLSARAVGILPAFGSFTGMHPIDRAPSDRIFAIAGDTVRALP